ncbi:MAG: hypothetical protein H7301_01900 [Cryobacterium sp.]|nr:hypothetical protein [Oligoflexia bacterium]
MDWKPTTGKLFSLIIFFLSLQTARASGICDYYRESSPRLYELVCSNGYSSSKPAGASSTFTSSFNLNSASLPTEPSSYGLESLGHVLRANHSEKNATFSIVKGFNKFGTGISTGGNNTFYGDDLINRQFGLPELQTFEPAETPTSSIPNLNIGTSLELLRVTKNASVKLGISIRHNRITSSWGGGPALAFASRYLTFGVAFSNERVSAAIDPVVFTTYQVSGRLSIFEIEYNQLRNNSTFSLGPIQIYTLTTTLGGFIITLAQRALQTNTVNGMDTVTQSHIAVQYLFSRHLSAGLLYNYIPGAMTLGAQIYL